MIADEERVCAREEAECLSLDRQAAAAGGQPDASLGQKDACYTDETNEIKRLDRHLRRERRAWNGDEEIERDAFG